MLSPDSTQRVTVCFPFGKAVAKAGKSTHAESGSGEPAKATAATTGNDRPGADELVEHARAVTRSQSRNKRAKQHA